MITLKSWIVNKNIHSKIINYSFNYYNKTLYFNKNIYYNKLIDFIIDRRYNLILGFYHYHIASRNRCVLGAGRLSIDMETNQISLIDNCSGHYKPSFLESVDMYNIFLDLFCTDKTIFYIINNNNNSISYSSCLLNPKKYQYYAL